MRHPSGRTPPSATPGRAPDHPPTSARLTSQRIGARAERVAEDYYRLRGFAIVGQNVRLGHLEVDLVARRGELLVMVEVRARGPRSLQGPFASVAGPKLRRLRLAAQRLWRRFSHDPTLRRLRLDVAAVDLSGPVVTIEVAEAVALG